MREKGRINKAVHINVILNGWTKKVLLIINLAFHNEHLDEKALAQKIHQILAHNAMRNKTDYFSLLLNNILKDLTGLAAVIIKKTGTTHPASRPND